LGKAPPVQHIEPWGRAGNPNGPAPVSLSLKRVGCDALTVGDLRHAMRPNDRTGHRLLRRDDIFSAAGLITQTILPSERATCGQPKEPASRHLGRPEGLSTGGREYPSGDVDWQTDARQPRIRAMREAAVQSSTLAFSKIVKPNLVFD
jgi:hypothetical protein